MEASTKASVKENDHSAPISQKIPTRLIVIYSLLGQTYFRWLGVVERALATDMMYEFRIEFVYSCRVVCLP